MSIYEQMKALGVEIDHHESDLYVPATPEARAIVSDYKFRSNVTGFTSQIDGAHWLDIPFAYDPWWDRADRIVESWAKKLAGGES